jgi:predicted ATP-dependent serine protease
LIDFILRRLNLSENKVYLILYYQAILNYKKYFKIIQNCKPRNSNISPIMNHALIRSYRPIGKQRTSPSALKMLNPIVGHQREIALLSTTLDAVITPSSNSANVSQGRILIIEGEAGIGKSRLIAEFMALTQGQRLIYLLSAGQSIELGQNKTLGGVVCIVLRT